MMAGQARCTALLRRHIDRSERVARTDEQAAPPARNGHACLPTLILGCGLRSLSCLSLVRQVTHVQVRARSRNGCPVTAQIARSSSLTCTEESSLTIHGGHNARFARFK